MTDEVAPWDTPVPTAAASTSEVAPWDSPDPSAAAPAPDETAGRIAGLGARALSTGVAGTLGTVANAVTPGAIGVVEKYAMDKLSGAQTQAPSAPYKPQLSDFVHPEKWAQAAEYFADKAGMPSPQGTAENIGYKAAQAAPSAVFAPEAPIAGAVSAMAGGAGAEAAKQAGASPLVQAGAGLAAGSVPALGAGITNAARGVRGVGATQAAIDDAARSGTDLTAGSATGSRVLQWAESALGVLPGGSGIIERNTARQRAGLSDKLDDMVTNLTQGQEATPTVAGTAVESGVKNTIAQLRADANTNYGHVDSLVPASTGIDVSKTSGILQKLTTPTPGAEAVTGSLISPKLKALSDNLQTDLQNGGGTLPYSAARAAKSALGEQIDWSSFPTDPANGQLKQVYNALRDDINTGASGVSPEAAEAVKFADSQYQAARTTQEGLESIVAGNGGPEKVFSAALNGTGPKGGATVVNRALSAMNPDQRNIFAGAVLKRMGTASPGMQGPEGNAFNADQFMTNWNKMNPEAKSAIFDQIPGGYRQNLDAFGRTIDRLKKSGKVLGNPPGTAKAVLGGTLLSDLIGAVPMAFVAPHVAIGQVATGLGVAAGANIGARVLTNPTTVRWLAQQSKMPGGFANVMNQTSQVAQQPIERASGGKVDTEVLVNRLINRWKQAKKATDESTKPLLKLPDATIAKALDIAGSAI